MAKYIIKAYCVNCKQDLSFFYETERFLDITAHYPTPSPKWHRCKVENKKLGRIEYIGVDVLESDNSGKQEDYQSTNTC